MFYRHRRFDHWIDRGGNTYQGLQFDQCDFVMCAISLTENPANRSCACDVLLRDCTNAGLSVGPALFESVVVENLRSQSGTIVSGAAFKHCTFRGHVGRLIVNNCLGYPFSQMAVDSYNFANTTYYKSVDWALDIRDACFTDAALRIPARLIRRNTHTSVVVTKARLSNDSWKAADYSKAPWIKTAIELLSSDCHREDEVFVAPLALPTEARCALDVFEQLKSLGVGE